MLHNSSYSCLFTIPRVAFIVKKTMESQITYIVHEEYMCKKQTNNGHFGHAYS